MNYDIQIPVPDFGNYNPFFLVANIVATTCTLIVIFSIIYDFVKYHRPKQNEKKRNNWVETGSMFVYFFIFTLFLKPEWGKFDVRSDLLFAIIQLTAISILIISCYVNIKGRLVLQHNWANQVTIYHNHTLITNSVYKWVRHPLYASLIWMFIAGSLIFCSYLALLSVIFIFVPMMYYRAKQEEQLLTIKFPEYLQYQKKTGMFFPKIV